MNSGSKSPTMSSEPFRCVLVGIPSDQKDETPALSHAVAFADASHATLSLYVFAPRLRQPFPWSRASASGWLAEETERLEKCTSSAARTALMATSNSGLHVTAEHPHSPFESRSERFVNLARVHDVAVLDAVDASKTAQTKVIEDVLLASGRPLLIVPRHGGTAMPRRIAIIWDASAPSARAVKDALPLLAHADKVVAITVAGERYLSPMAPGADLATYLLRHGIDCKLATLAAQAGDVAERIRLVVAEEQTEMIVMGTTMHSRCRWEVLGGVAQSLLVLPPVPLFLAH